MLNENGVCVLSPAQAEAFAEDGKAHDIAFAEGVAALYKAATETAAATLPPFERSKTLDVINKAYSEIVHNTPNRVWMDSGRNVSASV